MKKKDRIKELKRKIKQRESKKIILKKIKIKKRGNLEKQKEATRRRTEKDMKKTDKKGNTGGMNE